MSPGDENERKKSTVNSKLLKASALAGMTAALLVVSGVAGAAPDKGDGVSAQDIGTLAEQEITSGGPITRINVDDGLQNDVDYRDVEQTYPDESGTHLAVGDQTFGERGDTSFTPVSQTQVTGSGTERKPFKIVTRVAAGDTGITLTQTDTYVKGDRSYNTRIKVSNDGTERVDAILYRFVDCEVGIPEQDTADGGPDDGGFGKAYPKTGSAACVEPVEDASTSSGFAPGNNLLGLRPLSKGSKYQEGIRRSDSDDGSGVVEKIEEEQPFDNTVDRRYDDDNAVGLDWRVEIPAGGSVPRSSIMSFAGGQLD